MNQPVKYSIGRGVEIFLLNGFLGAVWGVTVQGISGLAALILHLGFVGWYFLGGAVLFASLFVVKRVVTQVPPPLDKAEARRNTIDKRISIASFALAYVTAWILLLMAAFAYFNASTS